jgi:hypothetical protein
MSIKLPDSNITCPYTWHEKKCRDLALNCPKFIRIDGKNPQSEEHVSEYGCSDTFIPMMLIENSQMQRQTASAVESFRNEMVQANRVSQQVLLAAAQTGKHKLTTGE